ncbi:hypothetical protein DSCW_24460 [Desulfosarcina widdelii]|uniref:Uncharacterized protein n=1 Tax=Desulfosarcina widdelii TaxID=947919 RepID=A0A5K7Z447_9BACT|nr:hypothetical protein [Desulfosarcina widdelii]BBO75029.1 hypothetical protein DSCW_24460 [Desulfosarcina widdelii]
MKEKSKSDLLFRKAFIPWYDTELSMLLTLVFAVVVLLFSITGVAAGLDTPRYSGYIWIPCMLGALSLVVTVSTLIRLIRRGTPGSG